MLPLSPEERARITAVILAGGLGRRMGGQDKGLTHLAGRPMAAHVLERLIPQVGTVIVNANRNTAEYERLGVPVISDRLSDFQGPLAGVACAFAHINTPLLLTVPCDSPLLPVDLATRLYRAIVAANAEVAVAHDGERIHPVFALLRGELRASLEAYLAAGERKIERWFDTRHCIAVDYADLADAFLNINDADALADLEERLRHAPTGPAQRRSTP